MAWADRNLELQMFFKEDKLVFLYRGGESVLPEPVEKIYRASDTILKSCDDPSHPLIFYAIKDRDKADYPGCPICMARKTTERG